MARSDNLFDFHLERLRSATVNRYTSGMLPEWISQHTRIRGENYSFKDHEFQERILRDESVEVNIRKCAQVGVSEMSVRMALALCAVMPNYTIIYTVPTATFAEKFMRTRVDPVIQTSPYLREAIHKTMDSASIKQFGESYLNLSGSQSSNAPISTPADHLIHDERDFSDDDVITQYHSRLGHSPFKRKTMLSTPTLPKMGIDAEFRNSRRFFNFTKCDHCNYWFNPDYYKHVKIPDYVGALEDISKNLLINLRWKEARIECPSCGATPSLQIEHRDWVCENPTENHVAAGYQVSPFDAPNVITCPDLIRASTTYNNRTDFVNFSLGLPAEDKESSLGKEDMDAILVPREPVTNASFVMGLDMGGTCAAVIGAVMPNSKVIIVHTEQIPLNDIRERRKELAQQFRIRMTVVDALPHTETVMRMQEDDPNLFAAWYVNTKSIETHRVVNKEEDEDSGMQGLRQVHVNRDKTFDLLMGSIRAKTILKMRDDNDRVFCEHHQEMKRVRKFNDQNEVTFTWKKPEKAVDHYHHANLYMMVAAQMCGVSNFSMPIPFLAAKMNVSKM